MTNDDRARHFCSGHESAAPCVVHPWATHKRLIKALVAVANEIAREDPTAPSYVLARGAKITPDYVDLMVSDGVWERHPTIPSLARVALDPDEYGRPPATPVPRAEVLAALGADATDSMLEDGLDRLVSVGVMERHPTHADMFRKVIPGEYTADGAPAFSEWLRVTT